MKILTYTRLACCACLFLFTAGCEVDDDDPQEPAACMTLQIVDGNNQQGSSGTPLPEPLQAKVTDAQGQALAGVAVRWEVLSGGGSVSPASSSTNAQGIAQTSWQLGAEAGRVQATVDNPEGGNCPGPNTVEFTAEPQDLSLTLTNAAIALVALNDCDVEGGKASSFVEGFSFTSTGDITPYFLEVEVEFQFSTDQTSRFFTDQGYVSEDGKNIFKTHTSCYRFANSQYLDTWYTVKLYALSNGQKTGDALVTSNKIGPVRTQRPEGAIRIGTPAGEAASAKPAE